MSDPHAGLLHILRRSLPWVRLLSIAGFVCVGVFAMLGLALWTGALIERNSRHLIAELIFCAVMVIAVFVPSLYLHQSVGRIAIFLAQGHIVQLEAVLDAQRKFWRFAGTVALVWLACLTIGVIGIMAGL